MKREFEIWMVQKEGSSQKRAYDYTLSLDTVAKDYAAQTGGRFDIYKEANVSLLKSIAKNYGSTESFGNFPNHDEELVQDAMATYIRFLESSNSAPATREPERKKRTRKNSEGVQSERPQPERRVRPQAQTQKVEPEPEEPIYPQEIVTQKGYSGEVTLSNFTSIPEDELQDLIVSQVENLFPGYQIFGDNEEGIQCEIGGETIDLLLESESEDRLLAVVLKSDGADFKDFGQISMQLGLLSRRFSETDIKGLIIAGEVDESLRNACLITDKISIKKYSMKLSLEGIS